MCYGMGCVFECTGGDNVGSCEAPRSAKEFASKHEVSVCWLGGGENVNHQDVIASDKMLQAYREWEATLIQRDELNILAFALRYAVRCHTSAIRIVARHIMAQIPRMTDEDKRNMIAEIEHLYFSCVDESVKKCASNLNVRLMNSLDE